MANKKLEILDASGSTLIMIDESKLNLCIQNYTSSLKKGNNFSSDLIGSIGILISIVASILTSDFHTFINIYELILKGVFITCGVYFSYRTIMIIIKWKKYKEITIEQLIEGIKSEATKKIVIAKDENTINYTDIK